jgi:hypothetical protein
MRNEAHSRTESEGLLSALVGQRARLLTVIDGAMQDRNFAAVTAAERALSDNINTVGRLLGQLVHRTEHRYAFTLSPDYLAIKAALVRIVREHPELTNKLTQALAGIEADAADMIKSRSLLPPQLIEVSS